MYTQTSLLEMRKLGSRDVNANRLCFKQVMYKKKYELNNCNQNPGKQFKIN